MSNSGEIEAQIRRWSSQVAIKEKRKPVKETKEKNPKSPAHPPYFQMIKEAIRALNKKEGSSPYAIAKYMENKHKPVLPANFRKILGLQLKNSVYKGTLIKIKASYKLSEGEITTTTTKVARANAAEPNEPIKKKLKTRAVSKICSPTSTTRSNARAGPRRTKRSAHAKPKEPKSIKSPVIASQSHMRRVREAGEGSPGEMSPNPDMQVHQYDLISDETGNLNAEVELHPKAPKKSKTQTWFIYHVVSNKVSDSFKSCFDGPYTCFKDVPASTRLKWWHHFRAEYKWAPENARLIYSKYIEKLKLRLKDESNKVFNKKMKPWYMIEAVWDQVLAKRATPAFRRRSAASSKNKLLGPKAKAGHCQGSVSSESIKETLTIQNGRPPTCAELFKQAHLKKDGSFSDDRAKSVWEEIQDKIDKTQDSTSAALIPDDVFFSVVGGYDKKGRVYGLGSSATSYFAKTTSIDSTYEAPSTHTCSSCQELEATRREMQELKKAVICLARNEPVPDWLLNDTPNTQFPSQT